MKYIFSNDLWNNFNTVQKCPAYKKQHFQSEVWCVSYEMRNKLQIRVNLSFLWEQSCTINEPLHANFLFSFELVHSDSNAKLNLSCFSNFYCTHSFWIRNKPFSDLHQFLIWGDIILKSKVWCFINSCFLFVGRYSNALLFYENTGS